jgi:hypothetical protein
MLSDLGEPYIAVRLGYPVAHEMLPPQVRRFPTEAIEIEQ